MPPSGWRPPTVPPTAKQYTEAGLPWFEWYGRDSEAVDGAEKLAGLKSVAQFGDGKDEAPLPENESVDASHVVGLRERGAGRVREYPLDDPAAS